MTQRGGRLKRMLLFAIYGGMMFAAKVAMEALPNIHPVTMLTMTFAVVYGFRALVPVYIYVLLDGLFHGFGVWWLPYTYIWALYCVITALLPKNMKRSLAAVLYPALCALFGLCFGALYAPAQAALFRLDFASTAAWVAAGLPFDAIHAAGNLGFGLLILPLSEALKKLHRAAGIPLK